MRCCPQSPLPARQTLPSPRVPAARCRPGRPRARTAAPKCYRCRPSLRSWRWARPSSPDMASAAAISPWRQQAGLTVGRAALTPLLATLHDDMYVLAIGIPTSCQNQFYEQRKSSPYVIGDAQTAECISSLALAAGEDADAVFDKRVADARCSRRYSIKIYRTSFRDITAGVPGGTRRFV